MGEVELNKQNKNGFPSSCNNNNNNFIPWMNLLISCFMLIGQNNNSSTLTNRVLFLFLYHNIYSCVNVSL